MKGRRPTAAAVFVLTLAACDPRVLIPAAWIELHGCEETDTCCEENKQCRSGLCNPRSAPLSVIDPADAMPGECVPSAKVAVVDNRPNSLVNGQYVCRAMDDSFCEIAEALQRKPPPRYVLVKFSPDAYAAASGFPSDVSLPAITILGPPQADEPRILGASLDSHLPITIYHVCLVRTYAPLNATPTLRCGAGTNLRLVDTHFFPEAGFHIDKDCGAAEIRIYPCRALAIER